LLAAAAGNRASSGGGAAMDVNASAAAMGVFGAMGQWNNDVRVSDLLLCFPLTVTPLATWHSYVQEGSRHFFLYLPALMY
jgi:hypothetical protein